jgi:hypothetical protein
MFLRAPLLQCPLLRAIWQSHETHSASIDGDQQMDNGNSFDRAARRITALKAALATTTEPGARRILLANLDVAVAQAARLDRDRRSSERMAALAGNDRPWLATTA